MPTPRKPGNVLSINGASKRNPGRLKSRKQAGDQRSLGRAPAGLTDVQRACWRDIVRRAIPGVLTYADGIAVEMCARLLADIRGGDMQSAKMQQLTQLLHKMGLTPQGRNHVSAPEKPEKNPFADL